MERTVYNYLHIDLFRLDYNKDDNLYVYAYIVLMAQESISNDSALASIYEYTIKDILKEFKDIEVGEVPITNNLKINIASKGMKPILDLITKYNIDYSIRKDFDIIVSSGPLEYDSFSLGEDIVLDRCLRNTSLVKMRLKPEIDIIDSLITMKSLSGR